MHLVDSPVMRNLVALDLASNPLDENGVSVLADSPHTAGLVDLGLCGTGSGNAEIAALAGSRHFTNLRSLDLRSHQCWSQLDRDGEDWGGIGQLSRSPVLGQLRRLLLAPSATNNGWTADVLSVVRPHRRPTVVPDRWQVSWHRRDTVRSVRSLPGFPAIVPKRASHDNEPHRHGLMVEGHPHSRLTEIASVYHRMPLAVRETEHLHGNLECKIVTADFQNPGPGAVGNAAELMNIAGDRGPRKSNHPRSLSLPASTGRGSAQIRGWAGARLHPY